MNELMRLIQWHLDQYGPSRAEFARRVGAAPQTVQNWKARIKTLPNREHLEGVAKVTGLPYLVVLDAALLDAGYRDGLADDLAALKVRIARYVRDTDRGIDDLDEFLSSRYLPSDYELTGLHPDMGTHELDALIDRFIAETERAQYGNVELFDRELLRQYLRDKADERTEDQEDRPGEPLDGTDDWHNDDDGDATTSAS